MWKNVCGKKEFKIIDFKFVFPNFNSAIFKLGVIPLIFDSAFYLLCCIFL